MFLFGKKEKRPIEEYLNRTSPVSMRYAAMKGMSGYFYEDEDLPFGNQFSVSCSLYLMYSDYYEMYRDELPKSIRKEHVPSELLLRLSSERGDPAAPALLAIMYEHGLSADTPRSQEKADLYYAIARERGCSMVDAIDYIKKHMIFRSDLSDHLQETLAYNLYAMTQVPDVGGSSDWEKLYENKDDINYKNILGEMAVFLILFYAA